MLSTAIGQDISKRVRAYNKAGLVDSSIYIIDKEVNRFQGESKWDSMATLLNLKSEVLQRIYSPAQQLQSVIKHEEIIKAKLGEDHPQYLNSVYLKGYVQVMNGLTTDGVASYDWVIGKDKAVQSPQQYGQIAAVNKAFVFLYTNKVKDALSITQEALASYKEGIDTFFLLSAYQVMSQGHAYNHDIAEAMVYDNKALALNIKRFGPNHPNVGLTLDQIGGSYRELGQFNEALKYQTRSRIIQNEYFKKSGNVNFLSNVLGNTSLTYTDVGEYNLAFENIEQACKLQESIYDDLNINLLWYYEASIEILIKSERYAEAQQYMKKAMRIVTENAEAEDYDLYFLKSYQAELYHRSDKLDLALQEALGVHHYLTQEEDKSAKDIIHIVGLIADIYLSKKDFIEAKKWIDMSQQEVASYYSSIHSEALSGKTRTMSYYLAIQNYVENEAIYKSVLEDRNNGNNELALRNCIPDQHMLLICQNYADGLYRQILNGSKSEKSYFDFLEDFEAYYEVHLSAIRSATRLKAESRLLKAIYLPGIILSQKTDPEMAILLSERIKSFHTRLILKNQLIQQEEGDTQFADSISSYLELYYDSSRVSSFVEFNQLIEDFKDYKDSLYTHDIDQYRRRYGLKEVTINSIKNTLTKGEMLIEYYQYDSLMYAIYISATESHVRAIDYDRVNGLIASHLNRRTSSNSNAIAVSLLDFELIRKYDKLLIVPDDKLFFINFEELIMPSGKYLIEEKTIRYAYSASILDQQSYLTSLARSNQNILSLTPGFSSQLKESYISSSKGDIIDSSWLYLIQQPFLINLASNLNTVDRSVSLTSMQATESNYKNQSADFKILHLGTHGILNDESPLFSKLIFAKDSIEDGYLHTYEIYGQTLNADLAVLSACNSGNGQLVEGEGVLSLAHAFTHAGCPATLMTLWAVDEKSTSIILESFYKNLRSGQKKSVALRNAKLSFLESSPQELRDPYYWAGLVLIGSDASLFSASGRYWWLLAVLAFMVLFVYLYLARWRKSSFSRRHRSK